MSNPGERSSQSGASNQLPHTAATKVPLIPSPSLARQSTQSTTVGNDASVSLIGGHRVTTQLSSRNTAVPLSNTHILSPQAISILQRQIPASGVLGLSCVTPGGLQQVLQGTPLTLVATNIPSSTAEQQSLLPRQQHSGATIHHLGLRGLANTPISSQSVSFATNMNTLRLATTGATSAVATSPLTSVVSMNSSPAVTSTLVDIKPALPLNIARQNSSSTACAASGPSPKKIKLEERPANSLKVETLRKSVSTHKRCRMKVVKSKYRDHLAELFYLQGGGNMVEFQTWKKKPTQPLLNFLEGSKLDSDDDEDYLQEKKINDEVKVLTNAGSNVPMATPVAIATTLPPSVSALNQATTASSELQHHLTKSGDAKSSHVHKSPSSQSHHHPIPTKSIKSQSTSPGRSRQAIAAVYDNVAGSQDVIVERAKQEAQVIQRVNELRKEGLWTAKRLPRVQEPPRQKAHWDYLLEEMTWLAADFIQERKWKKATSRKIARMISNYFREKEMKELKAEKEEAIKLKKIASQMAKMVKEFWNNIEKVVQYKQTTRLEEKKKKALDLHLSFIVDQTEKYSSWLTAGLQSDNNMSKTSSVDSDYDGNDAGDTEFKPVGTASDDEETIEKEENEAGSDGDGTKAELEALHKESELPLEEILKSLPKEMLEEPSSGIDFGDSDTSASKKNKDEDFQVEDEDEEDEEETIEEQEHHEKDYSEELGDLKAEGELSVEELRKKYAGAYDSDFEMPEESSEDESSDDNDDEESSGSEKETGESEDEEEKDDEVGMEEDQPEASKETVGLEFLVKEEKDAEQKGQEEEAKTSEAGPGKEFNDIAAAAQSLQPKGYTLETTEVKTTVPFLLKHTLREYQHVGLDWLATMHEKRLNGILADEMGLGKTIQTIAMLAHLACEKGVWGPHLIVVPTSVMLNWEMELKKWCPSFKILTYYGSIKERKLKRQGWTKTNAFHVCITSYKLVVQDHQAFRRKKWKYFILDEAQNIKNFKSQRWQMLLNFSSQRRLLLTGTPLQNSLMELWSLMHFLMPNVFQSHSEFKEWFSNPLTGMIEGSQEYNESLVRRLHKVLRPFLLRRLKNEVEKQMPQKFEHVVMCRLSKRQRFLYDDFMSQSKTKDTLASGHFMSVINILMQLRKVCNHPNLFDPRPIISPFKMEGIVYSTASLVANALSYDPFRDIDLYCLYPSLADMELDLPGFVAERVKRLQAPRKLIEEVDSWPLPTERLPKGQLKNLKFAASLQQNESVSSSLQSSSRAGPVKATVAPTIHSSQPSTSNIKLLLPSSSSSSTQQSILIPNPSGSGPPIILPLSSSTSTSGASSVSSTSAAIAQAKLLSSQLQSGLLHLVQTSSGHQLITAASSTSTSSTSSNPSVTTTSSLPASLSSSSVSVLKISSSSGTQEKPVMKVTPFVVSPSSESASSTTASAGVKKTGSLVSSSVCKKLEMTVNRLPSKPIKKSELFLESLYRKKEERRQHLLSHMARVNQQRCSVSPVMGEDTRCTLQCFQELSPANTCPSPNSRSKSQDVPYRWAGAGYANCLFAQNRVVNHNHPRLFWRETSPLLEAVRSPEDHIKELQDILHRYVFVTPTVISPNIEMHVAHPDPTALVQHHWRESQLKPFILHNSASLHPIQLRTQVQFPEPRLIQYDCGKLQTMDILLRKLKSGQHRVLIFTQMTKMLDVLEAFLNFHGHRYLRLDGTTRVEQRQFLMDRFNADPRIFCFILSTRSGGVGVNLTGADTVIFYDSDWNPTMDAQAQDRCHRIGQTRDVHIYRLVSEMTVEENILKKANQKRLLGDLAIEGGNFTTAFFKQQTINDLFAEPSGLESLMEAKEEQQAAKAKPAVKDNATPKPKTETSATTASDKEGGGSKKEEAVILTQFEQALCKAEDETDAQAAKQLKAEQKAELAEFDESIPWDEREAEMKKEEDELSKVEMELAMLDKELTPIERYAVCVVEAQTESETAEELKMAEEDIENSKKDWELARLKALKEEEERKAELEDDEMLYIYSKDESQVKKSRSNKKTPAKRTPKSKAVVNANDGVSGSEGDESVSLSGRGGKDRQMSPSVSPSRKKLIKAGVKAVKLATKGKGKASADRPKSVASKQKAGETNKKKVKINGEVKVKAEPKAKGKGSKKNENIEKVSKVKIVANNKTSKETKDTIIKLIKGPKKEVTTPKKEKASPKKATTPPGAPLVNGHCHDQAKLETQARNALLKKQALQASHIVIAKANGQTSQPTVPVLKSQTMVQMSSPVASLQQRMPTKPSTPKSPQDPNVPPPWSNPNLVIRTRKAAVHSPVVLNRVRTPVQSPPAPVAQQSQAATRLPVSIAASSAGVRIQTAGVDRNIFQLFNPNAPGVRLAPAIHQAPTIRQVMPGHLMNQIPAGATLINQASLVNTLNIPGARFIATGMAARSPNLITTTKPVAPNPPTPNITLVPTVINTSRGPGTATLLPQPQAVKTASLVNSNRLPAPITLQGVGGLPLAVNLIKTNTGVSVPLRPQQVLQASSFAQLAGTPSGGYVLITPKPRLSSPAAQSSTSPAGLGTTRLLLTQVPTSATIIAPPRMATIINGLPPSTPPAKKDT